MPGGRWERGLATHPQDKRRDFIWVRDATYREMFLYEQARFYLQHYLLRHDAEFTQCIKEPGLGTCKDREGHCRARFCKISSQHLGPLTVRLQRRNLGSKDPADRLISTMLIANHHIS